MSEFYLKGEEWKQFANCKGEDLNDFFDNYEESNEVQLKVDRICASCVVRNECLEWALENKMEGGVFGRKYLQANGRKRVDRRRASGYGSASLDDGDVRLDQLDSEALC